jgi:predicted transposase YbfD/YdcC
MAGMPGWRARSGQAGLVARKQAHYLFVVNANQPTLLERLTRLAWHKVLVADRTRDRGLGRVELRTLKAVTVNHFGFPHAAQVLQVTRKTRDLGTRRRHTEVVYAITSLSFAQTRPARLAHLLRGHWTIENGLHWERDVTFAEDASQLRAGTTPQVMACMRHHSRGPHRPLVSLGISPGETDIAKIAETRSFRWRTPMLAERLLSPAASQAIPDGAAWCRWRPLRKAPRSRRPARSARRR